MKGASLPRERIRVLGVGALARRWDSDRRSPARGNKTLAFLKLDASVFNALALGLLGIIALCASYLTLGAKPQPPGGSASSGGEGASSAPPRLSGASASPAPAPAPSAAVAPAAPVPVAVAPPAPELPILRIFWGSQTGTATSLAKSLVKHAHQRAPELRARDVDLASLFPPPGGAAASAVDEGAPLLDSLLREPCLALFLTATYGEGDPTDNAAAFVAWLQRGDHPPGLLSRLRFAVFGLGNRQYELYNKTGKVVDARLEALGAQRMYRHGEGDDNGDLDEDFEQWRDGGLWEALKAAAVQMTGGGSDGVAQPAAAAAAAATKAGSQLQPPPQLPLSVAFIAPPPNLPSFPHCTPTFQVAADAAQLASAAARADPRGRHFFLAHPLLCTESRELRKRPSQGASTWHVELELPAPSTAGGISSSSSSSYATADNCLVCPENDPALVAAVAQRLGLDLNAWFTLAERAAGAGAAAAAPVEFPFPTPTTVKTALTCFLDIAAQPRRELFAALAPFATAKADREGLAAIGSGPKAAWSMLVSGAAAAAAAAAEGGSSRVGWGLLALLRAYPSLSPPWEALCQVLPLCTPRTYTIASSALASPRTLALCASVLHSNGVPGLCTSYLARCTPAGGRGGSSGGDGGSSAPASAVRCLLRPSSFKLPGEASVPVILVGPGTGIAPMRAFIAERAAQAGGGGGGGAAGAASVGAPLPTTVLFFGCRARDEDFIYESELREAQRKGVLSELHCAFSREGSEKVYVQHLVAREGEKLWEMLEKGKAYVFVCGATNMGASVLAAFQEVSLQLCTFARACTALRVSPPPLAHLSLPHHPPSTLAGAYSRQS